MKRPDCRLSEDQAHLMPEIGQRHKHNITGVEIEVSEIENHPEAGPVVFFLIDGERVGFGATRFISTFSRV